MSVLSREQMTLYESQQPTDVLDTLDALYRVAKAAKYAHKYIERLSAPGEAIFRKLDDALAALPRAAASDGVTDAGTSEEGSQ